MFGRFGIWELALIIVILLITVVPFWKIFSKAGYPGWLSISQVIPFLNIIVLFVIAFSKWPIYKKFDLQG